MMMLGGRSSVTSTAVSSAARRMMSTSCRQLATTRSPRLCVKSLNTTTVAGTSRLPSPFQSYVRTFSTRTSMEMIKELRSLSGGAPIGDCKKALVASNNDMKDALNWLREHGAAKVATKVSDREANEGLVAIATDDTNTHASIVQVTSETDFAGRSTTFVDLVVYCATAALEHSINDKREVTSVEELLKAQYDSKTVEEAIKEAIISIRENLSLAKVSTMNTGGDGVVVGYVHNRILPSNAGTAAALVDISPLDNNNNNNNKTLEKEEILEIGKKLAMHIVAARPLYMTSDEIPKDVLMAEKEVLQKQLEQQESNDKQKSPEIIEKIIQGRIRKYYETICLVHQNHMIENDNPKIEQYLQKAGVKLNRYELMTIG